MSPATKPSKFPWVSLALLGWLLGAGAGVALGQQEGPLPPKADSVRVVLPSSGDSPDILERLGKMEERLDSLTRQNGGLLRENQALAEKAAAGRQDATASPLLGPAPTVMTAPEGAGAGLSDPEGPSLFGPQDVGGQPGGASERRPAATAGGGSKAGGGGDPTTIGRAQEVGNRHLGKVGLNLYYDFDGGVHVATKDEEFSFGIRGMTQLDGMLYARPTPGIDTSSGFYNPRSRIYFEGHATQPISWEFSFQNFFDTVQLLDAYVNFAYDPRFEVQLGRYKAPFGYEFYRIHIWDLMAPERSLWAVNYEANRRFGAMAHGTLADQRVEYAVGSFDTQRNSFAPSFSRQDLLAFVNFKPFFPREEGFLLRNLQFGGSCDVGNEHQSPVPAALRTNFSPGPATVTSTAAANAAELPFLTFGPNVLERGGRALWEAHLAYYYGGLSLVSAIEGGHEGYANGSASPVHVPVNGWFVQGAYILTGETIRDRTLLQPLSPFDLRQGRFGPGAWEVTARYS
jgi:phosphate-selective porin OprO/OprP